MVAALVLSLVALLAPTGSCYPPPVEAPVADPFRPPACRWCPGNRGLEYTTSPGTPVKAIAPGRVVLAGTVVETRYVVVDGDDGRRVTYGRLAEIDVVVGLRVSAGAVVGRSGPGLFLGVRDAGGYVDPAPLLGRWVRPSRLVPLDGQRRRPARPGRLVCLPVATWPGPGLDR